MIRPPSPMVDVFESRSTFADSFNDPYRSTFGMRTETLPSPDRIRECQYEAIKEVKERVIEIANHALSMPDAVMSYSFLEESIRYVLKENLSGGIFHEIMPNEIEVYRRFEDYQVVFAFSMRLREVFGIHSDGLDEFKLAQMRSDYLVMPHREWREKWSCR